MRTPAALAFALLATACNLAPDGDEPSPSADLKTTDVPLPSRQADGGVSGAADAPKKAAGAACVAADDCESGVCTGGACQAPAPDDGVQNGDEADVDCGGASAPACAPGKRCAQPSDCTIGACGVDGRCPVSPSCTARTGAGDHCGPNHDESCCASARVPATGDAVVYTANAWNLTARVSPFRLDKYEVTVGRLRAFFDAMGGDPQSNFEKTVGAGAGAHPKIPGSGWRSSWNKRLPSRWADIHSRYGDPAEALDGAQYCMRGAGGEWGTTTWRRTPDANPKLEDNFELKPVVCLDWYTLFAFCAWDGGRLPTHAEWGLAAGDDAGFVYPWGNDAPTAEKAVMALNGFAPFPNFTWGETIRLPGDRGTHIAPPGKKTAARFGHHDLAGNVAEWLLDAKVPRGWCDDCADLSGWKDPALAWPDYEPKLEAKHPSWLDGGTRVVRGGTWEGHDVRNVQGTWDGVEVGFTYHALGGRCARDL